MTRAALLCPLLLSACFVGGGDRTFTFDDVTALQVDVGNGSVVVEPTTDDVVTLDWEGGGIGTAAVPQCDRDESGLVTVDMSGPLGGADLHVAVPDGVNVAVSIDHGDLDLAVATPVDVLGCIGAGDVTLTVPAGGWDLHLDGGVGDVQIDPAIFDDPSGPYLGACLGAGSLQIEVYTPPVDL